MDQIKISPITILFTLLYLLLGFYYRRLTNSSASTLSTPAILASLALWLIEYFLSNGMFQQKNRLLFTYGIIIGVVLVVSLYLSEPFSVTINFFN